MEEDVNRVSAVDMEVPRRVANQNGPASVIN